MKSASERILETSYGDAVIIIIIIFLLFIIQLLLLLLNKCASVCLF